MIIPIVKAAVDAAMMVGLPEARIPLADAVVLVCNAPKSNSADAAVSAPTALAAPRKLGIGIGAHLARRTPRSDPAAEITILQMAGTVAKAVGGRKHVRMPFHHIVTHQGEAPALHLIIRVIAPPVANRAEIAARRIVRRQIELHVEIVFVIDGRVMHERENRHLVEVAEDRARRRHRKRMPFPVSVERIRDIPLQVGVRLFLRLAVRAAVHFKQQLPASARRVDASGEKFLVESGRHRLADDPCVDDTLRRMHEIVRLQSLRIGRDLMRLVKELFVARHPGIVR